MLTDDEFEELVKTINPLEIFRQTEAGRRFFGYGPTQLAEKIKDGEIPAPMRLGARAQGWSGAQIIAYHRELRRRAAAKQNAKVA